MKRLISVAVLAACVLMIAGQALALNPQSQGRGRKAVAGGTKSTIMFGPADAQGRLPTGYVMHSGDGSPFWYSTFYMLNGSATLEPVPVKVPSATTIVAPDLLYISDGQLAHMFVVNALQVAATDSVFVDPLYGGLGK